MVMASESLTERIENFIVDYKATLNDPSETRFVKAIKSFSEIKESLSKEHLLFIQRNGEAIKNFYFYGGQLYYRCVNIQKESFTTEERSLLFESLVLLRNVIDLEPFHKEAIFLYKWVNMSVATKGSSLEEAEKLLENILSIDPSDFQVQYNLGFFKHQLNKLEDALKHFKMCIGIIDLHLAKEKDENVLNILKDLKIKCLNGLGGIYYTVQDREIAKYYFLLALKERPEDPDICNQLGVVHTELRNIDTAIEYYQKSILYAEKANISTDKDMLIASAYMNMGLARCYEIDYPKAIECYNKALKRKPMLSLAYQNKLLDLNYISHLIEDPMYISDAHKKIDKMYPKVVKTFNNKNYKIKQKGEKLIIGFMSGDFVSHPVSYFMKGIFQNIDLKKFEVHLFSLKINKPEKLKEGIKWHLVKNIPAEKLCELVRNENVDIMFDLSTHTGDNRLDAFALKLAPIQISYLGYPNTSGLSNMDYHITDTVADSDGKTKGIGGKIRDSTQKYYSEKLIFMEGSSFITYHFNEKFPDISKVIQPIKKNGYLTLGTFNRYNKMNEKVTSVWEKILLENPNVKLLVKTKEFLTQSLLEKFKKGFKNQKVLDRITVMEYKDTYEEHLTDYNQIDIALDTFPYSGTTTSCEALVMGVPIITLYDEKRQYHSQNVTASILHYSNLDEYVVYSEEEYIKKIKDLIQKKEDLFNLKNKVRSAFKNGSVCNNYNFTQHLEMKLQDIYYNHFK